MKLKAFFIIFEGLSLKQIKKIFLEGEITTLSLVQIKSKMVLGCLKLKQKFSVLKTNYVHIHIKNVLNVLERE